MKFSEQWLREWVNPKLNREKLGDVLTMAGFEVEEIAPVAGDVTNLIVARVIRVERHPEADRLSLCDVDAGKSKTLHIVCGAPNVRAGMFAALALTEPKVIRGVKSEGMLCSPAELGLSDDNSGLLELGEDAHPGESLKKYLQLDDHVITVAIMPDRGDCLSLRGMSREVATITRSRWSDLKIKSIKPQCKDRLKIKVNDRKGCPHYVGRVIRNVNANIASPAWLKERLRRCGARSISAIVDVTNYVLFELGQPMHAFDLNKINGAITVRRSKAGEKITLLDDSEKELNGNTMLIADNRGPLAIAGVMGGLDSAVSTDTSDIFLESAFFTPETIAKQRQFYNLNSDSSYRYERGVDPGLQKIAIERATQLILAICGGTPGPLCEESARQYLPKQHKVGLTRDKLTKVLGVSVKDKVVDDIFKSLQFSFTRNKAGWQVQPPSWRFDIAIPEDLVEEVGRLYGYDKIPMRTLAGSLELPEQGEDGNYARHRHTLAHLGYHETVSYSFVDRKMQQLLDPQATPRELINPITAEMTVMRTNMWPGLLTTLHYNHARQQQRVRLFEIGTIFLERQSRLQQLSRLAGLISGTDYPEQWGTKPRKVDFYDLKGDVDCLLQALLGSEGIGYKVAAHPALHPGQSAAITYQGRDIGILGALNPNTLTALDLEGPIFVFELDLSSLPHERHRQTREVSRFPEIRRDVALIVNEAVPSQEIQDTIRKIAGDWLKDVFIFDVYKGKGISPGHKSIALGLVIQHPERTLVDEEITELMDRVISTLQGKLGAELRS